ncbi:hypothetical protein PG988_002082 [Apiospora saccharicola]
MVTHNLGISAKVRNWQPGSLLGLVADVPAPLRRRDDHAVRHPDHRPRRGVGAPNRSHVIAEPAHRGERAHPRRLAGVPRPSPGARPGARDHDLRQVLRSYHLRWDETEYGEDKEANGMDFGVLEESDWLRDWDRDVDLGFDHDWATPEAFECFRN